MTHDAQTKKALLPRRRGIVLRPETREGRRAVLLAAGGLAVIPLTALLVRVAHAPSAVGILGLLGLLTVVAGGAYAIAAIVRLRERSILVFATLLVGLFATFFVIGEIASIFIDTLRH